MRASREPNDHPRHRVVVVIGNFVHEGLSAKVESLGLELVNRQLRSTPKNWRSVIEQLRTFRSEGRLAAAFVYMPSTLLLHIADETFDGVRRELVDELRSANALVFAYEENLQGRVEPLPWDLDGPPSPYIQSLYAANPDLPRMRRRTRRAWLTKNKHLIAGALAFLADLTDSRVVILPFRKRNEVTVQMFQAVEDAEAGIFLRLYVPHGRYQSEQFEEFLGLFNRFLREAEARNFQIDVERSRQGTTYVFVGRGETADLDELRAATTRFDAFLRQAQLQPKLAEKTLTEAGVPTASAPFIVAKYGREVKRLVLETRHEFERRHLALVQQFEAEALDAELEAKVLPIPAEATLSGMISIIGNTAPVSVSVGLAGRGGDIVQSVATEGVVYGPEDEAILRRIGEMEDELDGLKLRSDLDRLKDASTSPEDRKTAVQRLKGFLYRSAKYAGRKADEIATKVLIAYLELQLPKPQ